MARLESLLEKPATNGHAHSEEQILGQRELARDRAREKAAARTAAKRQQAAERIASATAQLSSGVEEATAAISQLEKGMEQISSGAQEASTGAQQSLAAIEEITAASTQAVTAAQQSLRKVNAIQTLVAGASADIELLIEGVTTSAKANLESAKLVGQLEKQSAEIGNIVEAVVRIADQTNLLALNAAIEAARAGQHGKGFAVVADEVRNLAETSEKSARNIRDLVEKIQSEVKAVVADVETAGKAAQVEAEKAKKITSDLKTIETDASEIQRACIEINENAKQASEGAKSFQEGSQQIATAAEESSSAAVEATKATEEQGKALAEMSKGADNLQEMAEGLKTSTQVDKSSQELAAAAEELSATIQEANSAATQIMSAIQQISKGAQQQAAASEQSGSAAKQIEAAARGMQQRAEVSGTKCEAMQKLLGENKRGVDSMIQGINDAAEASVKSAANIKSLEERTRLIDKIVDAIVNVTIQTNLLAVNGSIEAARAGEYGRGFAVVAADVRNLAGESSENADKIKDLVRNIQQQIVTVANDIEAAGREAAAEVKKAQKTTADLDRVAADMDEVLKGVKDIKAGQDKAVVAIQSAVAAVQQIAKAAELASSASNQCSSAAQQGSKGMTLAVTTVVLVSSHDSLYAVPMESVRETVKMSPQSLKMLNGRQAISLRGQIIPVVSLAKALSSRHRTCEGSLGEPINGNRGSHVINHDRTIGHVGSEAGFAQAVGKCLIVFVPAGPMPATAVDATSCAASNTGGSAKGIWELGSARQVTRTDRRP